MESSQRYNAQPNMPVDRPSISQFFSHDVCRTEGSRETDACRRFTVWVDRAQTSGPLVDAFLAGQVSAAVLGLSPTSSTVNLARLATILDWTLGRANELTVIEGSWFHRWDRVVFGRLSLAEAERASLRDMRKLHGRIRRVAESNGLSRKLALLTWPEAGSLPKLGATARAVGAAMERSPEFRSAMISVVGDYLAHVRLSQVRMSPVRGSRHWLARVEEHDRSARARAERVPGVRSRTFPAA